MTLLKSFLNRILITVFFIAAAISNTFAQAELMPSGNLEGIRIEGQLMPFHTDINLVKKGWSKLTFTGKEMQRPKFKRTGDTQVIDTKLDSVYITETVKDIGQGKISLTIRCEAMKDTAVEGVFMGLRLPANVYSSAKTNLINAAGSAKQVNLNQDAYTYEMAGGISYIAPGQSFSIQSAGTPGIIRNNGSDKKYIQLYFPISSAPLKKGDVSERTYIITVSGVIDRTPAILQLDSKTQGRPFAGLGGNFRLQNPRTDPQVIDYCLKNLRVAFSRVEMPWRNWQPSINIDPVAHADSGKLNNHVKESMEMAQRLGQMNIPVIVSAWSPPQWAVDGPLKYRPTPDGVWGNPLKKEAMNAIYKSITDYVLYLKDHYHVEAAYFSFNESDLGINVRQTGEEHAALIKGLGAYFASKGLKTKLLLGDNSDATTYKFIYTAMNDPEARPYIGAVSFHSWRGWETETLLKWADAAKQLNVPLLVGEGSIDAAAWQYPAYFEEQSYALEEINLYTRLMAICQPLSILQWQLTADYSPLTGGGIFGDNGPLKPTQRFWQLKQLASTPQNLYYHPLTTTAKDISCAALGNADGTKYTMHIVNNGTARKVTLKGLPSAIHSFKVYITDKTNDNKQAEIIKIKGNQAAYLLKARSFTTLIAE